MTLNKRDYLLGYLPDDFDVMSHAETLSPLVVYAAGSIDEACLEREGIDSRPVEDLSNLLANTAIRMKENSLKVDPSTKLVLYNTLTKYYNKDIQQEDELAIKIAHIAQELKNFRNLPKNRLKTLRSFCLDLSEEITPYLAVIHV